MLLWKVQIRYTYYPNKGESYLKNIKIHLIADELAEIEKWVMDRYPEGFVRKVKYIETMEENILSHPDIIKR